MKVAILGGGRVGSALGGRLAEVGVEVVYGLRDLSRGEGLPGTVAAPDHAVQGTALVLLAVPAAAAVEATRAAGRLDGAVVVDCTNPLTWGAGPLWDPPDAGSMTEELAASFPEARWVKGFNHFGAEIQADPVLADGPAHAFFAGDDDEAKQRVMDLARRMGFEPVDAGQLRNAGVLENLAVLWIHLATVGGRGRHFAFRPAGRAG